MSNKIILKHNKTLRLYNVLSISIDDKNEDSLENILLMMDNYMKSKGANPIGPIIQHMDSIVNKEGDFVFKISVLRQSNIYIHNVEPPYQMKSVLRIKDCMYVRYTGPESKLKFAYDKINLIAFEEDIELKGDSYTVFVNQVDDNIIADVFMEKVKDARLVEKALLSVPYSLKDINIFHLDHGNEYDNKLIDDVLEAFEIERSLSNKGNPYDNAVSEAANKIMKTEFIYQNKFKTLEELQLELAEYIYWYNNLRIHGSLGYLTPVEYRELSTLKLAG